MIYDKWEEVGKYFDTSQSEPNAITYIENDYSCVGIKSNQPNSVIHEAEHIKNVIWGYIGYIPQRDNDEVDAYLLTYIYKRIMEVFNKHDRVVK